MASRIMIRVSSWETGLISRRMWSRHPQSIAIIPMLKSCRLFHEQKPKPSRRALQLWTAGQGPEELALEALGDGPARVKYDRDIKEIRNLYPHTPWGLAIILSEKLLLPPTEYLEPDEAEKYGSIMTAHLQAVSRDIQNSTNALWIPAIKMSRVLHKRGLNQLADRLHHAAVVVRIAGESTAGACRLLQQVWLARQAGICYSDMRHHERRFQNLYCGKFDDAEAGLEILERILSIWVSPETPRSILVPVFAAVAPEKCGDLPPVQLVERTLGLLKSHYQHLRACSTVHYRRLIIQGGDPFLLEYNVAVSRIFSRISHLSRIRDRIHEWWDWKVSEAKQSMVPQTWSFERFKLAAAAVKDLRKEWTSCGVQYSYDLAARIELDREQAQEGVPEAKLGALVEYDTMILPDVEDDVLLRSFGGYDKFGLYLRLQLVPFLDRLSTAVERAMKHLDSPNWRQPLEIKDLRTSTSPIASLRSDIINPKQEVIVAMRPATKAWLSAWQKYRKPVEDSGSQAPKDVFDDSADDALLGRR